MNKLQLKRNFIMKNNRSLGKQHGFFSLGIALGLTLIFGGTAVVINNHHTKESSLAKQDTETVENTKEQVAIVEPSVD